MLLEDLTNPGTGQSFCKPILCMLRHVEEKSSGEEQMLTQAQTKAGETLQTL